VNGELTEVEGIFLLTLWGTHREMGYAHGYLYAPEVFEPDEMLMHVAFAEPGIHATARRRVTLDVAQLLN
jgi:hypothetical protein